MAKKKKVTAKKPAKKKPLWMKRRGFKKLRDGEIAELKFPTGTKFRLNKAAKEGHNKVRCYKHRASIAHVVSIHKNGKPRKAGWSGAGGGYNCMVLSGKKTRYRVGEAVIPNYFDKSTRVCAAGIHFFLTKSEAENYAWN